VAPKVVAPTSNRQPPHSTDCSHPRMGIPLRQQPFHPCQEQPAELFAAAPYTAVVSSLGHHVIPCRAGHAQSLGHQPLQAPLLCRHRRGTTPEEVSACWLSGPLGAPWEGRRRRPLGKLWGRRQLHSQGLSAPQQLQEHSQYWWWFFLPSLVLRLSARMQLRACQRIEQSVVLDEAGRVSRKLPWHWKTS